MNHHESVCLCVCLSVCLSIYACMHACMYYVCMYVCMSVCMYVWSRGTRTMRPLGAIMLNKGGRTKFQAQCPSLPTVVSGATIQSLQHPSCKFQNNIFYRKDSERHCKKCTLTMCPFQIPFIQAKAPKFFLAVLVVRGCLRQGLCKGHLAL